MNPLLPEGEPGTAILARARQLVDEDAVEVYDAAASVGQIAGNLPRWFLVRIVARFLLEGVAP